MTYDRLSLVPLIAALCSVPVAAQCGTFLTPGTGIVGFDGPVAAFARWDPDGAGPQPEVLVCGGAFSLIGTTMCGGVVAFDPQTGSFAALGSLFREVGAVLVTSGGELLAGGELAFGGGHVVASWNGATWSPFGTFDRPVRALLERGNGDLVAGGEFLLANGSFVSGIARWNGAQWSGVGGGVLAASGEAEVRSLVELPGGDLVAAGRFDQAGAGAAINVARWSGTSWSAFGAGLGGRVYAAAVRAGALYAGGKLAGASFNGLATWNGTNWVAGGAPGTQRAVTSLAVAANNELLFATVDNVNPGTFVGDMRVFRLGAAPAVQVGTRFVQFSLVDSVHALAVLPGGDIAAGGSMVRAPGVDVGCFAVFDGTDWQAFGDGIGMTTECVTVRRDGTPVVGGWFAGGVAERLGSSWQVVGGGVDDSSGSFAVVTEVLEAPNGDLIVAGQFDQAGGAVAGSVARWDGTNWDTLAGGVPASAIQAMALLPDGDLVVGGQIAAQGFSVPLARYDGAAWSAFFGPPSTNALAVVDLDVLPDGSLFALARVSPTQDEYELWRFDGGTWSQQSLPTLQSQEQLTAFAAASVGGPRHVATTFGRVLSSAPGGGGWTVGYGGSGQGALHDIEALPGGRWIAASSTVLNGSPLIRGGGTSIAGPLPQPGNAASDYVSVADLHVANDGAVHMAGFFFQAGGAPSAYHARLESTCAGSVVPAGTGCAGSGGANVLRSATPAWIDATFVGEANGMPQNGLALGVFGLQTVFAPLPTILPQGQAGCDLLVSVDLLQLAVPTDGLARFPLVVPNTAALLGATVHQQAAGVEIGTPGITNVTTSNRLSLTFGTF